MAVVKTINDTTAKAYERVSQRTHGNEQDTLTTMTMRITELHKHINMHTRTHTIKCQAMTMMTRYDNAKNEKFPTKKEN